jgi:hypothetical protein
MGMELNNGTGGTIKISATGIAISNGLASINLEGLLVSVNNGALEVT